jgi:hypothetical protein
MRQPKVYESKCSSCSEKQTVRKFKSVRLCAVCMTRVLDKLGG